MYLIVLLQNPQPSRVAGVCYTEALHSKQLRALTLLTLSMNTTYTIVGLGNPGLDYAYNRHNMGRMVVERIALEMGCALKVSNMYKGHFGSTTIEEHMIKILLPDTFMNASGDAVRKIVTSKKAAEHLIVVYDDIDVPWGTVKMSYDRGAGGHNGVKSIMSCLKTGAFLRIRVGVLPVRKDGTSAKPPTHDAVTKYLMSDIGSKEKNILPAVMSCVSDAIVRVVRDGREHAMNYVNTPRRSTRE
jgi:peptidyl-tRNA hydrolase, PTH1 family